MTFLDVSVPDEAASLLIFEVVDEPSRSPLALVVGADGKGDLTILLR